MVSVMTNFMYRCGGIGSHDNGVKNSYVFTPVKIFPNIRIFAQSVISYLMGKKKNYTYPIFSVQIIWTVPLLGNTKSEKLVSFPT